MHPEASYLNAEDGRSGEQSAKDHHRNQTQIMSNPHNWTQKVENLGQCVEADLRRDRVMGYDEFFGTKIEAARQERRALAVRLALTGRELEGTPSPREESTVSIKSRIKANSKSQ